MAVKQMLNVGLTAPNLISVAWMDPTRGPEQLGPGEKRNLEVDP